MAAIPFHDSLRVPPTALGAGAGRAAPTRTGGALLLYTPLLATTLLAKLSVPPFAAQSLSIAYLLLLLAMAFGLALGQLRLNGGRLIFYLFLVGGLGLVQILGGESFSLTSLLLLATLHLAYVVDMPRGANGGPRALEFFLALASALALLGIAQYGLQFVLGARYAFPIENFVPDAFVIQGFHMLAPIAYGVATYRANGVFFAEPSFFSQFMAVAIIVELAGRGRLLPLALYALALLLSYSGTGVLLLAICAPLLLLSGRGRGSLLWLGLGGLALAALFGGDLDLGHLTGRIGEFGSVHSSAYARFVGGFDLFDRYLWPYPAKVLLGYGAGQFTDYALRMPFPIGEMTPFKMVFEYGLLGAALYFSFIFYCVCRAGAPLVVRLAVMLTLLLSGPFVPFFHGLALSLLVWPAADPAHPAPAAGRGR